MIPPFLRLISGTLLLSSAVLCSAQSFQPKTIQFKGAGEYPDADLLSAANLKKGAILTAAEMNDHTKLLMDSGVFDNITFTFNGQDLVFQIIPSTTLYPLRFENLPIENDKELNDRLHKKLPLFHGKVPLQGSLLDDVRKALEEELSSKGIQATLSSAPYADSKTNLFTAMTFSISSPAVEIGEIKLTGASSEMTAKAQSVLARYKGEPYNSEGSSSQLEINLNNYYHELGYLQAATHAKAVLAPVVSGEAVAVPFAVSVDEGPQYKLAAIDLAPDIVVTQAVFDKQSPIHPGDIALPEKLRANWQYITRQYHNKGMVKVKIVATAAYDSEKAAVRYAITAEPGPVYKMGKLLMPTASDELRAAINSAWSVPAGATFNESATLTLTGAPALSRLFQEYDLRYSLLLHDDTLLVDVTLRFEKKH